LILEAVQRLPDRLLVCVFVLMGGGALANLGSYSAFGGVPDYISLGSVDGRLVVCSHGDLLVLGGVLCGLASLVLDLRRRAGRR